MDLLKYWSFEIKEKSIGLDRVRKEHCFSDNVEQMAVEFTKWCKINFSMECFTAGFLHMFNKKRLNI